jgi:hypothetical protein
MRFLFFLALLGLAVPQIVRAQFNSFEPGSYVLQNSPTVWRQSLLKLRGNDQLIAKDEKGKKLTLTPQQVRSFRLGSQKYTTAGNFEVNPGSAFGGMVERAFVELIDSGKVSLLRYEYTTGNGAPMMGANGAMTGGYSSTKTLYLLRLAGRSNDYPIPANGLTGAGRKFRDALLPHLAGRPDLIKLLEDQRILAEDMPLVVRALNTGQPMPPMPSLLNRE